MDQNHCTNCGKCCWDWKGDDPAARCQHLSLTDFKTCMVYDNMLEVAPACAVFPASPAIAVDLPDSCGFVIYWKEQGVI